ncbi:proline racemase family protein [Celeribacter litoreus]|uniref:proline racemase family protein n=1 Tax=Celeribacter litoreus TaxID=2876714 RepID=UPI001CC99A5E|nr:proline racemase family protein [Celeribacter litoreus]MCA0045065.1 proline racemase family protein [Celeribacter litoreus]
MTIFEGAFSYIDSHTAGHPTRVILSGIPSLKGDTVKEMRMDFEDRFDHLRSALLHEPRGHAAMVGLVPVPSKVADFGAIFISSYVYLGMCGHGTIGYAKTLAHTGAISRETGDSFTLETPAGVVTVNLKWGDDGELETVSLRNVPAFTGFEDFSIDVPDLGSVTCDILYSGMWYAMVNARDVGLTLSPEHASKALSIGWKIKTAIAEATKGDLLLADAPAPSVLFYEEQAPDRARHFLVLAPNKFDRSPCGTGTCARMAQLQIRGQLKPEDTYHAENIFGVGFMANLHAKTAQDGRDGYEVVILGSAYITSQGTLFLEKDDPLTRGFLSQ